MALMDVFLFFCVILKVGSVGLPRLRRSPSMATQQLSGSLATATIIRAVSVVTGPPTPTWSPLCLLRPSTHGTTSPSVSHHYRHLDGNIAGAPSLEPL